MAIIEKLARDIAEFLEEDPCIVREKLEHEIFHKGITVADAWKLANPQTPDEIATFYKTTDAYLYDLIIDHHGHMRQEVRQRVLAQLQKHSTKQVLDYGGGIGLDSIAIAKLGMKVTYYELAGLTSQFAEWLFAREGCDITITHSAASIPFGLFDGAVCIEVLEHVPDPNQVIQDIGNSLRMGGIALITESFGHTGEQYPSHLVSNQRYAGKIGVMMEKHGMAMTMRVPDEKPLEFTKMPRTWHFHYLRWSRRLAIGKDLLRRGLTYAGKLR